MVAILCDSSAEAKEKFDLFMHTLINNECESITRLWDKCNCVELYSHERYIFADHRMEPVFENIGANIIDEDDFLYGLDEFYC